MRDTVNTADAMRPNKHVNKNTHICSIQTRDNHYT